MTTVLVAGGSGLLGSTVVPYLRSKAIDVTTLTRTTGADIQVDLCNEESLLRAFRGMKPDFIINLASLTSVEQCEESPNSAYLMNSKTVRNLSRWIQSESNGTHLIHVSTDHLYDGAGLHAEDDITIRNTYALSKLSGELEAEKVNATILRTNFVGKSATPYRESLTDWVFGSLTRREHVQVLSDVHFSPLSMAKVSEMLMHVLDRKPAGTFNLGSRDGMSKSEFDFAFAKELGLPSQFMTPIESSGAKFLRAIRPKNMLMNVTKFEEAMGVRLPTLAEEIERVANEYK
jgi:dTDP-4-dehydrorhamnose reductase